MPDVLLQTLFWAGNPTFAQFDNSGSANFGESRVITAAESHDALDTTYEGGFGGGDGISLEGDADHTNSRSVTTASAPGTISFLRFKVKARTAKTAGTGTVSGGIQIRMNAIDRSTLLAITSSFVLYDIDFPTDPADSAPWTNTKINAQTFGVRLHEETVGAPTFATIAETRVSEYYLEIWGPNAWVVIQTAPVSCVPAMQEGAPYKGISYPEPVVST